MTKSIPQTAHAPTAADDEQPRAVRLSLLSSRDQILSAITQQLYGYNLTVDLDSGRFTLITGTGAKETIAILKQSDDYRQVFARVLRQVNPKFQDSLRQAMSLDYLRNASREPGFCGSLEFAIEHNGQEHWEEINVFVARDTDGRTLGNILGRDITAAHQAIATREMEVKAAAAKDRLLSGITQTLYGFNISVNLSTDTYTLIRGTGTEKIVARLEANGGKSYSAVFDAMLASVATDAVPIARSLLGPDYLMNQRHNDGFLDSAEIPWTAEDGIRHWCEVNVFMSSNETGDPVANILGRDITEAHERLERREREIRAANAKDQILSGITQSLYSYNITVNLESEECTVILGTGLDCLKNAVSKLTAYADIYRNVCERVHAEYRGRIHDLLDIDNLRKRAENGESGFLGTFEYPSACPKCDHHWCETHLFLGYDENGGFVANILTRDVTEAHERQLRHEREVEAANAKDRVLSEITQSLYGYNMTVNLRTLKYTLITGTGMDAVCGVFKRHEDYAEAIAQKLRFVDKAYEKQIQDLLAVESLRRRAADNAERGLIGNLTYSATVNGEPRWHETNVFLGSDANGDPIANILGRDITAAHEQADIAAKLEVASKANAEKSKFLFNMSHDIRTPMNAIIGFTDLALKNLDNREKALDCLAKTRKSSELLLSLINDILDMSRIESGKVTLTETPCDIRTGYMDITPMLQELAKNNDIHLSFTVDDGIRDTHVAVDLMRLDRVLTNLVSNAIKYTPGGGTVKVNLRQLPESRPGYGTYEFTVTDNGIGMGAEFMKHLFEPFAREENSTVSGI